MHRGRLLYTHHCLNHYSKIRHHNLNPKLEEDYSHGVERNRESLASPKGSLFLPLHAKERPDRRALHTIENRGRDRFHYSRWVRSELRIEMVFLKYSKTPTGKVSKVPGCLLEFEKQNEPRKGIENMTDTLPARQIPLMMKVKLIKGHAGTLNNQDA